MTVTVDKKFSSFEKFLNFNKQKKSNTQYVSILYI